MIQQHVIVVLGNTNGMTAYVATQYHNSRSRVNRFGPDGWLTPSYGPAPFTARAYTENVATAVRVFLSSWLRLR